MGRVQRPVKRYLQSQSKTQVCPGYWQCQNPFRMRRLRLPKAYLHKSKGVLDTGNTEALGKDDTHESGDSANGDAKKSRGSCCRGKVSDEEAWVGKSSEQSNHDVSANGQPFQRGRGGKSDTFIQFCFDPDTPFGIEKHKQWQGLK